jgi:hypothetical protein
MAVSILPDNPRMTTRRFALPSLAALLLTVAGCGDSGSTVSRPIETLILVSGAQGQSFTFQSEPDEANCGSNGTGIQSPNADHQFGGRVFTTPHLFVLENARQPIRAVIRNADSSTAPLVVNTFFAQTPQNTNVTIEPGVCQSVITNPNFEQRIPSPGPTPSGRGPEIRVEICAPRVPGNNGLDGLDLGMPCEESSNDWFWGYFASIGDVVATNISSCLAPAPPSEPVITACTSPSTFFLESPKDQVDAVMSVNPGQNPGGGQPEAQIRVEMWVNGRREAVSAGVEAIVSANL